MKARYMIATCIMLCLMATQASAQQTASLDLRRCLEDGLQNNLNLQITRNREEMAHNNSTWANAGAMPTVDASAGYRASVTNLDRAENRATGAVTRNTNYADHTVDAGVSLGWTLFDGFRIQTSHKQLRIMEQQGEVATRMAVEDLMADIASEYYNYLQQIIRSKNYNYAMELSRERLRIASINYQTGRFSGLDFHQAEVDYHSDSSAYVRQNEAVLTSNIRLNKLMGEKAVSRRIDLPSHDIEVRHDLNLEELWNSTLRSNTSLLYAQQSTQLAELDYKKVVARNYPYLKLNAEYGYTHNSYGINSTRLRDNMGLNGGLTMGINLWDGNRRRERKNAQLTIQNQKLEREQMELELRADLTTFWEAYCNNLSLLELQKKNLQIAHDNLEIAMERYKLGDLSGFDMRQIEKNLLDAEERVLQVQYDAKICEISLLLISGGITSYLQ